MTLPRVHLTGGDNIGWALDTDLSLTREALNRLVAFVPLEDADIVHSMWWEPLLALPPDVLAGKRVICHVPGEPRRYLGHVTFHRARALVGLWVAVSSQGKRELDAAGMPNMLIPCTASPATFHPLPKTDSKLGELREAWKVPPDSYLVGSFQRDSEGADLARPKLLKGPDVFAEIIRGVRDRGGRAHVVLAGPRRHWLCARLDELDIPFTYLGKRVVQVDDAVNTVSPDLMNLLYNLIDLYVVSSRTEGGPKAVMEAALAHGKVISTRVGLAEDVLEPASLYDTAPQAIETILADIKDDALARTVEPQYGRVLHQNTPDAVRAQWASFYDDPYQSVPRCQPARLPPPRKKRVRLIPGRIRKYIPGLACEPVRIGCPYPYRNPPWGGANQFLLALRKFMRKRGYAVKDRATARGVDVLLLNSIHFDLARLRRVKERHRLPVVHRIDGPMHLIRGWGRDKDDLCFEANAALATITVVQSAWCYERIVEMGYQPVRPVIIHNAVDPTIFNRDGRVPFDPGRKIRLVSASWSDNPRKGGPTYKWIEQHLDWDRFEYTFVGNASETFDKIRHIPPVGSRQLADILRQHDIYITASQCDPCSNSLIEALSCGLPALFLDDGGHPELVGMGGLPFADNEQALAQLDTLVENYGTFQSLISVPDMADVTDKYLSVLRQALDM